MKGTTKWNLIRQLLIPATIATLPSLPRLCQN